jgi:sugar/nucleoside kinase (ribokinase family)
MGVTVVGSIAFDRVKSPFGERMRMLGGAATHFALAASFFDTVSVVGPVGDDFGEEHIEVLRTRGTNVSDIERVPGGKTFFWHGEYGWDLNQCQTHATELGVFADFEPKLSAGSRECDVLFLANIQPTLQLAVRQHCHTARFVALDSMNFWIDTARDQLLEVLQTVDCVLLNDAELRQLTGRPNVLTAARELQLLGPRVIIAKQGEYGAAMVTPDSFFSLPAFPLATVIDPTGAGDTFAGGFLGYVARHAEQGLTDDVLRQAMAYGTALASFNVEEFGTDRVARLTADEIRERVDGLTRITAFEHAPVELATSALIPTHLESE